MEKATDTTLPSPGRHNLPGAPACNNYGQREFYYYSCRKPLLQPIDTIVSKV